jgi:hypothetical protein
LERAMNTIRPVALPPTPSEIIELHWQEEREYTGSYTKEKKRADALELMAITEDQVRAMPEIEPLLLQAHILEKVWDYISLGKENKTAQALLVEYQLLKRVNLTKAVPFEAYCVAAEVNTLDVLTILAKVLKSHADVLMQSKKLIGLHQENGSAGISASPLPGIEDDINTISDRFNDRLLKRDDSGETRDEGEEEWDDDAEDE